MEQDLIVPDSDIREDINGALFIGHLVLPIPIMKSEQLLLLSTNGKKKKSPKIVCKNIPWFYKVLSTVLSVTGNIEMSLQALIHQH